MTAKEDNIKNVDIVVRAQYIKDLSFENPKAPYSFLKDPKIEVDLEVIVNKLEENVYEVVLRVQAEAKADDSSMFILELAYAGVFAIEVEGIDSSHKEMLLSVNCPALLFPYARQVVSNTTKDAGYPPLMISPVDFFGLYEQRVKEMQNAQGQVVN